MADLTVSTTDPDATPMHQKKGTSRLGYQTHYVVDGGKARVILDVLVTSAEVTENLPMLEMLFRSIFRWRRRPRSVTGDATYGTRENIAAIEKAGIRAYTALADQERRTALFTIEDFIYDAQKDSYTCPAGETLHHRGHDQWGSCVRYAAKASACNACHLKGKCTKSPQGRWVSRSLEEEYLERVRAYRRTEPYHKALRKRTVWVEPLFGEAKEWHGLRRFMLGRLEKVNTEALLKAAGQNVKRLRWPPSEGPKPAVPAGTIKSEDTGGEPFWDQRGVFQQAGFFCELRPNGVLGKPERAEILAIGSPRPWHPRASGGQSGSA